jgi:hypothetical protein
MRHIFTTFSSTTTGGELVAELRAVGPGERPPRKRKQTLAQAAESGSHRDLLVAMRSRIARTVQSPKCPPRDLAALTRRLQDIGREIEEIDARDGDDDIGQAAGTADDGFDAEAL